MMNARDKLRRNAADSPTHERRYQDRAFAQRYLGPYEGPIRLETLAAWIIATRERRCVARALSAFNPNQPRDPGGEGGGQWVKGSAADDPECQPPPAVVLDIPCGTGKLAKVMMSMRTRVVAADLSMPMMECAKVDYQAAHFRGFVCSSAEQLPFCTAAFDTAVCLRFMHLVPPASRQAILKELGRVASGRVIVSFGVGSSFQFLIAVRSFGAHRRLTRFVSRICGPRSRAPACASHDRGGYCPSSRANTF